MTPPWCIINYNYNNDFKLKVSINKNLHRLEKIEQIDSMDRNKLIQY